MMVILQNNLLNLQTNIPNNSKDFLEYWQTMHKKGLKH